MRAWRQLVILAFMLSSCSGGHGGGGTSNTSNNPGGSPPYPAVPPTETLDGNRNFFALIQARSRGRVSSMPWAGYWWPYMTDGTSDALSFYEAAQGVQGAVNWEVAHHGTGLGGLRSWWGHCNGWAAAAVLFAEPRTEAEIGGVRFGVSEQKAILSEISMEVNGDFFGTREDDPNDFSSPTFQDVYPNQFFLIMTNYVGQGAPVIMDRYAGNQVWNHPIAGYQIAPIRPADDMGTASAAPDVYRVRVSMQVWWVRDDVMPGHLTEPFQFQDGPSYDSRTYRAEIWLDGPPRFDSSGRLISAGNVVLAREGNYVTGGAWLMGNSNPVDSHPDYMWIPHSVAPSSGFTNPNVDITWVTSHFGR